MTSFDKKKVVVKNSVKCCHFALCLQFTVFIDLARYGTHGPALNRTQGSGRVKMCGVGMGRLTLGSQAGASFGERQQTATSIVLKYAWKQLI